MLCSSPAAYSAQIPANTGQLDIMKCEMFTVTLLQIYPQSCRSRLCSNSKWPSVSRSSVDVYEGLVLVCGVESSVRPPVSQGTIGGMLFKTVQCWKYFALFRGGQPPGPAPRPAWPRLWGISQLSSDFIHQSSLNCAPDKFNFSHFSKLSLTTFINFIMFL